MTQTTSLMGKTAVLGQLADHRAIKAVAALSADAFTDAKFDRGELTLFVAVDSIRQACEALRQAGYNFFEDMTAIDWHPATPRYQLSYHLLSHKFMERIRLAAFTDDPDPSAPSITPLWPAANFFEREVFDLFGIRFEEHPDLRRIMMPDDWQGYPLRKDYPVEGYR